MNDVYAEDLFDSSTAQIMTYHSKIIQAFEKIKSAANNGYYECEFLFMPDHVKMILTNKGYDIIECLRQNDFGKEYKTFIVSWNVEKYKTKGDQNG